MTETARLTGGRSSLASLLVKASLFTPVLNTGAWCQGMAANFNQDKTANRVALCSAIFAGFAYVGYAVVRKVFKRGKQPGEDDHQIVGKVTGFFRNEEDVLGLEYEPQDRGRVFLRRLSGSRANGRTTENLLDSGELGLHSLFRPLSVRERIRELNLNANLFTDTLLILHGKKPRLSGPRSLPGSTFHSPTRILSPVDLHLDFLKASRGQENGLDTEGGDTNDDNYSVPGTPRINRRHSRRNVSHRSLTSSVVSLSQVEQEEAVSRAESLCHEKEEELTRRLDGFQSSRPRELTPYECRSLVGLLHCEDRQKIARTLVTVSNCAAFTRNQDRLREAGILMRLPALLSGPDREVQLAAVMACANLALNTGNMKEMEQAVIILALLAEDTSRDSEFLCQTLLALTNTAVLSDWHHHLNNLLPRLLDMWVSRQDKAVTFQAVRLLVNLGCSDETVPAILSSPCPQGLHNLLSPSEPEDRLLRSSTLLANLAMAGQRLGITDRPSEPATFQRRLFSEERDSLLEAAQRLMVDQDNYDVKMMARKLYTVLSGLGGL